MLPPRSMADNCWGAMVHAPRSHHAHLPHLADDPPDPGIPEGLCVCRQSLARRSMGCEALRAVLIRMPREVGPNSQQAEVFRVTGRLASSPLTILPPNVTGAGTRRHQLRAAERVTVRRPPKPVVLHVDDSRSKQPSLTGCERPRIRGDDTLHGNYWLVPATCPGDTT